VNLRYAEFVGRIDRDLRTGSFAFSEVAKTEDLEIPLHTHADPHFQFILSGTFSTDVYPGRICGPGLLVFNPAGTTHSDRIVSNQGHFATTSISSAYLHKLTADVALPDHPAAFLDTKESWLATRLCYELHYADDFTESVVDGLTVELLSRMTIQPFAVHARPPWLGRAIELMEDSFGRSIHVSDIASAIGVHPFHLTRTLRRFLGCSAGEYLRACRLRRTCELLRNTSYSLARIAAAAGFADQSELSKATRRHLGFTPAGYRRALGPLPGNVANSQYSTRIRA